MMLLPHKVGPLTLMRHLGGDGATASAVAILDDPAGKQVVARRVLPWMRKTTEQRAALTSRVRDIMAIQHPSLVPILDYIEVDGESYILADWVGGASLRTVLQWSRKKQVRIPPNIFLHFAVQACNSLEALHSSPGVHSGRGTVLHLGLSPESFIVQANGRLRAGVFGLLESPMVASARDKQQRKTALGGLKRVAYLSPEQTHAEPTLGPSSDIFSLGVVLYELLTHQPMFAAGSKLQTLHRIRRAEITAHLLHVKEALPGFDRILYRALSLNPRHRYPRALPIREDLRALMAEYSFSNIEEETSKWLRPMFDEATNGNTDEVIPNPEAPFDIDTTEMLLQGNLTSNLTPSTPIRGSILEPLTADTWGHTDAGQLLRRANTPPPEGQTSQTDSLDHLRQRVNSGTPPPASRSTRFSTPAPQDQPDNERTPHLAGVAAFLILVLVALAAYFART